MMVCKISVKNYHVSEKMSLGWKSDRGMKVSNSRKRIRKFQRENVE